MKNIKILLVVLSCTMTLHLHAQKSVEQGDKHFESFNFEAAAATYEQALDSKKGVEDEGHVHARIGDCYRLMNNTLEAERWYFQPFGYRHSASQPIISHRTVRKQHRRVVSGECRS